MKLRKRQVNSSDVAEITLMSPGDILFLYTDGEYDGSDEKDRLQIERVIRNHKDQGAKEICDAIMQAAVKQDGNLRQTKEEDRIDDKTVFIIKRGEALLDSKASSLDVSSPLGKNVGTVSRVDSDFFASLSAFSVCALSTGDAGTLR